MNGLNGLIVPVVPDAHCQSAMRSFPRPPPGSVLHIMAVHGQVSFSSCAMALCFAEWSPPPSDFSLVISAGSGCNLFFGFFLVGVSDPRSNRAARDPPRGTLSS